MDERELEYLEAIGATERIADRLRAVLRENLLYASDFQQLLNKTERLERENEELKKQLQHFIKNQLNNNII